MPLLKTWIPYSWRAESCIYSALYCPDIRGRKAVALVRQRVVDWWGVHSRRTNGKLGVWGMIYNELYEPLHSGHILSCVNTVSASPHTKSSVACHKYSVFYDMAFQYCLEEEGGHKNDFPVMQSITMINIMIIICGENNTVCGVKVNSLSLRCRWHWQMGLQIGEWDKKGKH